MSKTFLLGLDLGTSGVKALLLDPESDPVDAPSVTVDLSLSTPQPGWSEQDPEDWWRAATSAIRLLLERSGANPASIAGLATSGQMHGATLLDGRGQIVRPCILWNDQRSGPQSERITQHIGFERLLQWVGNPALAGFTLPKLLWVREHEPDAWKRISLVLLPKDYLNYRLTGTAATEPSDASGTLLFDVSQREWSESMLAAVDISPSLLPPVAASEGVVGHLRDHAAAATGLRSGLPVIAGGADNACAAVGTGVVRPGQVVASIGTSGTLLAPTTQPRIDAQGRLHTFCHVIPHVWYLMGVVLSAGGSLRWYRDTIADPERVRAQKEGRDAYEIIMEEAATIPPGSDRLIFLPYLTGERTPHGDADARGVYFGLSLRHTRAHLARSVIEGVTFALGDSATLMRDLQVDCDSVRATGGGARSGLWREILAAVLNARILTMSADTGPALGAAILAGVGTGVFSTVEGAVDQLVATGGETVPDPHLVELYTRYRAVYDTLYPSSTAGFRALADLP